MVQLDCAHGFFDCSNYIYKKKQWQLRLVFIYRNDNLLKKVDKWNDWLTYIYVTPTWYSPIHWDDNEKSISKEDDTRDERDVHEWWVKCLVIASDEEVRRRYGDELKDVHEYICG